MPLFSSSAPKYDPAKLKANLKMCVTRIRMQQNKRVNSVKRQRKELAELINVGKLDACRIRVEAVIREDLSIEGLELLALYTDLLATRIQVINDSASCPPDLKEAATSVLWAASRVDDIAEFAAVRQQLAIKYGKEFLEVAVSNAELSVNRKLIDKLSVQVPTDEVCVTYLEAIADEYNLNFDSTQLKGPQSVVSAPLTTEVKTGHGGRLVIPPIGIPRDELEARLLALKRQ